MLQGELAMVLPALTTTDGCYEKDEYILGIGELFGHAVKSHGSTEQHPLNPLELHL